MSASPNFPGLPPDWIEQENHINKEIFARVFRRKDWGRGRTLIAVHGFGEQSNRYMHLPHYLESAVDVIIAPDLPGHGNSAGARGHGENIEMFHATVRKTCENALELVRKNANTCHLHVLGHSFGGLVVAHGALVGRIFDEFNLRSLTLSSPFLEFGFPVPALKKRIGLAVEPFLGWLPMKNELNANELSHDPSVVEAYIKDPLNHSWITPRMFVHMSAAMESVMSSKNDFTSAWQMIVPEDDRIASVRGNLGFYERHKVLTKHKCQLHTYPGFFHESFNEVEKERPLADLREFLISTR